MKLQLKVNGKVVRDFEITDAEIKLAETMGLTKEQYIAEYAKLLMNEKNENTDS